MNEEFAGGVDNEDERLGGGPRLTIAGGSGFKRRQHRLVDAGASFILV